MYTKQQFQSILSKYGENRILSIQAVDFAGQVFDEHRPFSMAENFDDASESFIFYSIDMYGNTITTLIPLDTVRAVLIAEDGVDLSKYKRSYLKG